MSDDFQKFQNELGSIILSIDEVVGANNDILPKSTEVTSEDFPIETESLLQRCYEMCDKYDEQKPLLRVIHHLACSGGTLVSKCIAAMPNVYLLSEVHPYTDLHLGKGKPKYLPSDIISLSKHADIPRQTELAAKVFKASIEQVYQHLDEIGSTLVLRDHTHSDFCVGSETSMTPAVTGILAENFTIKSLITLRDPIDSYLSLVKNGWVHFEPNTFDDYCARIVKMLDMYPGVEVVLYENFVDDPMSSMAYICEQLELPFSDFFLDIFDSFRITGDSGRGGDVIATRSRGEIDEDLLAQIEASEHYKTLNIKYRFNLLPHQK